jgi:hypothetical protein
MPFTAPKFNASLDRWTNPHRPATSPSDFQNNPYQVYVWSKQANYWFDASTGRYFPTIIIREPSAPPQGFVNPGDVLGKDVANPGFPILWLALFKTVVHEGFPNIYQAIYCVACDRNGAPLRNPFP